MPANLQNSVVATGLEKVSFHSNPKERQWQRMFKVKESESEVAQSCLTLCDPWTVARQSPLSMEFSRQEYWSGLPLPSPGDLSNSGIEPGSPTSQADSLPSQSPGKPQIIPY